MATRPGLLYDGLLDRWLNSKRPTNEPRHQGIVFPVRVVEIVIHIGSIVGLNSVEIIILSAFIGEWLEFFGGVIIVKDGINGVFWVPC